MSKNKEYAKRLQEMEGYERKIIAFKLYDEIPKNVEHYGDDVSFLCAICSEVWEGRKPFYVTKENVMCGGSVYAGIGSRKMSKEEYDAGASTFIGPHKAYASREVLRRVNQQIPHHLKHHKYLVIGALEDVEDPDLVMVVAEAHKIMRLCKVYTWKTGELVQSLQGTAWCTSALPMPYRTRTMTFTMGDPPSRNLMQLKPGEMYGIIHYDLLPLIVENFDNISSGDVG
ncbi:MAG: DUF169 domain-containing protein [Deltaproteobacteria bacterium]|nr:DUF169 domain-containing protein [Deltaproteobacteria bacterium]